MRWRAPRTVFVNSMSDLFHDEVPSDFIADVFRTMAATPSHTYQVLTKRPGRMASLLARWQSSSEFADLVELPNVWLGTSVENQRWTAVRVPKLAESPGGRAIPELRAAARPS
jgi:protein gp37